MAKYTVVGLGASGRSAVKFLQKLGHEVRVTDAGTPTLDGFGDTIACYFGGIDADVLSDSDTIVISPGVDPTTPAIAKAKAQGIPIVSDVQLFVEALKAKDQAQAIHTPIVAITGSNAKSTVTTLVGLMAQKAGKTVGVGGNIGTPALDLLDIDGMDMVVLELSSFQLEMMNHLGADVATILNLSADHLDRHGDMTNYLAQKLRIFDGAKSAVIWLDDEQLAKVCATHTSAIACYTTSINNMADFWLSEDDAKIWLCLGNERLMSSDELLIKGKHNLLNALSAMALALAVGLPMQAILDTLKSFKGLPHRCEFVADYDGKAYFNDSKGTNIGATISAIHGLGAVYGKQSLAVILGGQGKGQDFGELCQPLVDFAHSVYVIGQDAPLIEQTLARYAPSIKLIYAQTLDKAVQSASQSSAKVVLLSPACASLDQFKNYNERGECFVSLVKKLDPQWR